MKIFKLIDPFLTLSLLLVVCCKTVKANDPSNDQKNAVRSVDESTTGHRNQRNRQRRLNPLTPAPIEPQVWTGAPISLQQQGRSPIALTAAASSASKSKGCKAAKKNKGKDGTKLDGKFGKDSKGKDGKVVGALLKKMTKGTKGTLSPSVATTESNTGSNDLPLRRLEDDECIEEDPSAFPSSAPVVPSVSPSFSQYPSKSPTGSPTSSPSGFPTPAPTMSPTGSPTAFPSAFPTLPLTPAPTMVPTAVPTPPPTAVPTPPPTMVPTAFPTSSPTSMTTVPPTAMTTFSSSTFEPTTFLPTSSFFADAEEDSNDTQTDSAQTIDGI